MMKKEICRQSHTTKVICYDNHEKKCNSVYGFCYMIDKYDDRGNSIERIFLDKNESPVECHGYYRSVSSYDEYNQQIGVIYYNKNNKEISNQISTKIIILVSGITQDEGLPVHSILLQWNSWVIGDAIDAFSIECDRSLYGKKDLYFLTPDGEIKYIHIERGLTGFSSQNFQVEKSLAEKWKKKLIKYKKEKSTE
jgi:hypothetical protein